MPTFEVITIDEAKKAIAEREAERNIDVLDGVRTKYKSLERNTGVSLEKPLSHIEGLIDENLKRIKS